MYPKSFFEENKIKEVSGRCFVLMPFRRELQKVFTAIKKTLACEPLNFECIRADDIAKSGHILEDVLTGIGEAEVVIVDLTDRNPNVLYELGIAHMNKDVSQVVLIDQTRGKLPFDVGPYRCIQYNNTEKGLQLLQEKLAAAVRSIAGSDIRFKILADRPFHLDEHLLGSDLYMYEIRFPQNYLGNGGAKIRFELIQLVPGKKPKVFISETIALRNKQTRELPDIGWKLTLERATSAQAFLHLSPPTYDKD